MGPDRTKEVKGREVIDYDWYENKVKNNGKLLQFWQLIFDGGLDYKTVDSFNYEEFLEAYSAMKLLNDIKEKKIKNKSKGVK